MFTLYQNTTQPMIATIQNTVPTMAITDIGSIKPYIQPIITNQKGDANIQINNDISRAINIIAKTPPITCHGYEQLVVVDWHGSRFPYTEASL